jgi:predicted nucleic acid-binding protein
VNRVTVLDASAAIHMVMATDHAADLASKLEQSTSVSAPDLFVSEVGNSLWKYIRQGTMPLDEALGRVEEALALADQIVPCAMLLQEAVAAAARYEHPVYDMMYAVLARRQGGKVLTMDRSFAGLLRRMEIEAYCPLESGSR